MAVVMSASAPPRRRRMKTIVAAGGRRRGWAIEKSEFPALHFLEQTFGLRLVLFIRPLPQRRIELRGPIPLGRNDLLRIFLGQPGDSSVVALGHHTSSRLTGGAQLRGRGPSTLPNSTRHCCSRE